MPIILKYIEIYLFPFLNTKFLFRFLKESLRLCKIHNNKKTTIKMSMNNLTIDGEFRYIVQWFNEWSELQRDDFVPILVKYITGSHTNDDDDNDEELAAAAVTTPVNMNGLPNDLEFSGRPMSLFQCRVRR